MLIRIQPGHHLILQTNLSGAPMSDPVGLNRDPFDPKNISQETLDLNDGIQKLLDDMPPVYTQQPQQIRDEVESGKGLWPITTLDTFENRQIPGPNGDVTIRVFTPENIKGVYLHIHGGGFMLGRAHHSDVRLVALAETCGVATVSVDYRLAPEHPYPAGLDDCEAAAVWLIENTKKEFGNESIVIGGESAGGNLSVATLLKMRDRHNYTGFAAANLVYGGYDLNMTPSTANWGEERNLILTTKLIEWFNDNYIPGDQRRDPYASPLYADLSDLPPALFTVGTLDPLLDDSLFMHSRWLAAGNKSELAVYPGGSHSFNVFPTELATQANGKISEFITAAVG